MAILLSEAGLLERSHLLGTDCRGDAIERARLGHYDAAMLKLVRCDAGQVLQPAGAQHVAGAGVGVPTRTRRGRPVEALRRQVHWKVADLLAGVEEGPWDIILWRNTAIYLRPLRWKRSGGGWCRFSPRRA